MTFISKKTLVILAVASFICSRAVFFFIDDPEGPNLLIVFVLAGIIFLVVLGIIKIIFKIVR
jgi:hypothetical protein